MEAAYLSCTETAKIIRAALKRAFPGVKFSVRSDTYSGGASIDVAWTDGPTSKMVGAVTSQFSGARFDGMIDLKVSVRHWLAADGTVTLAHNPGTVGSRGVIEAERVDQPSEDCRLVRFGADYIFTKRRYSEKFLRQAAARLVRHGVPEFAGARIKVWSDGDASL